MIKLHDLSDEPKIIPWRTALIVSIRDNISVSKIA